jgi:thymidylate synthase ThyX
MIYAKVIADSINTEGDRLTTMEVQFHRFILPEFNTHRVFSRNSASSRAIPISRQIEKISKNPAFPVFWGVNKPGMQAEEELAFCDSVKASKTWLKASKSAVKHAKKLEKLGVHKQTTNRLLEPFMWHKVIVSSTEWDSFFEQRCSPLAQPEIREVADLMKTAYESSTPALLIKGEYHLPYLTFKDLNFSRQDRIKMCVARCARVSYDNHDGSFNQLKDLQLFDRLANAEPPHWSPMEHIATPSTKKLNNSGNFAGFSQVRHNLDLVL